MKQLLRKTYDFELELKDGRTVLFKIEQGSLRELLQMSKAIADEGSLKKWLVDFLIAKKPEDAKIEPEDFEFLMPERVVEIVDWLTRTYAKGFFARRTDKKRLWKRMPQQRHQRAHWSASYSKKRMKH